MMRVRHKQELQLREIEKMMSLLVLCDEKMMKKVKQVLRMLWFVQQEI